MNVSLPVFLVIFGAIGCLVFFQLFTRRGREWLLGGRIARTFGSVVVQRSGLGKTTINVHALEPKHLGEAPRVGIEIATRALLGASTTPLTLSQQDARDLSEALKSASEYHGSAS